MMLESYAERWKADLEESVIPFWLRYSLDREQGGYFTGLDRDGTIYDPKKYMWLQGRELWMFARLYNEWDARPEYLDAARLGAELVRTWGRDGQGRVFFSLTRDGWPVHYQRKPYGAVFCMMGLLEFYKATGEQACLDEAVALYDRIRAWIAQPEQMGRPAYAGGLKTTGLANVMVLASMAIELLAVRDDPVDREVMRQAMSDVRRHYDPQRRVLVENAPLPGEMLPDWPEARLFIPGHSIEVAWFLLHMLEIEPDAALSELAQNVIEGSLELGWDQAFGGLYYMMDLEGRPLLQLEGEMKLWWPHTEALYALVLAYQLTREERWLRWLERVNTYSYEHFADPAYGEWFGYCTRRGERTHSCKGGNYKGCFHVPRALMMCVQRCRQG